MTAKDIYFIRKHPLGGYAIAEGSTADTGLFDEVIVPNVKNDDISYSTIEEAEETAESRLYQFGGSIHPECYNQDYTYQKEWYLGGDYECESCGFTNNMLTIIVNESKKSYKLIAKIGCYSEKEVDLNSAKEDIREFFNYLQEFEDFDTQTYEYILGTLRVLDEIFSNGENINPDILQTV